MGLNPVEPNPIPEEDNSTIYTAATPPETVTDDLLDDLDPLSSNKISQSSIPWPGSTYIIRCAESGDVLTLQDGQIVLAPPGGPGSIHWSCVETKGWLGFRNSVSGRFLGHNARGRLLCAAERQQGWENFCVRLRPDGGYVLLMTHFERLWHVGIKVERGVETLEKIGDGGNGGIIWEFVKI
jgi:hypothetical protein